RWREARALVARGASVLRLGDGGGDLLMLDERGSHVPEQGGAVARSALKLTSANTMAHRSFLSFVRGPYQVTPATQFFGATAQSQNDNGEPSKPAGRDA